MTKAEFLECLRTSRNKFLWTVGLSGKIRAFRRDQHALLCKDAFCPITAVCYEKTGLGYTPMLWQAAADALDLDMCEDEQLDIILGADGTPCAIRIELEEAIFGKVVSK